MNSAVTLAVRQKSRRVDHQVRRSARTWTFAAGVVGIFILAFSVRLLGNLRGAGLYGLGNYDDGVHFAAALGLINGLMPYRDFLLLHPPVMALTEIPH